MLCENLYNIYNEIRLSAVGSKNDKQTDVKNKWPIISLWKTTFM